MTRSGRRRPRPRAGPLRRPDHGTFQERHELATRRVASERAARAADRARAARSALDMIALARESGRRLQLSDEIRRREVQAVRATWRTLRARLRST